MNLTNTKPVIIALDHGYGNIKTAHAIFKTGVTVCEKEPTFSRNLLIYEGKYYLIGDEHKEFTAAKMNDQDYYILTLAAIGIELTLLGLDSARVHLAAGLPLTWVSEQKEEFKAYLLQNKEVGCSIHGLNFNRHTVSHLIRASQEGIAFSFRYGIDIMKDLGLNPGVIRAGKANMFLSPLFRSTLATLCDSRIELFDTDGALGAARGAALGAGIYKSTDEAFANLERLDVIEPEESWKQPLEVAYSHWKQEVSNSLK